MRTIVLALLLFTGACGQSDSAGNRAEAVPGAGGPGAGTRAAAQPVVAIAATGPGGCAASWDGQPVTPAQITERGIALLERAIESAGGAQNVTEESLPILDVEAPPDLGFTCADTILFALQRAGMFNVRLRPAGGEAPVLVDFPLDANLPPPPVPMVIGIGAGGRVTWNGDPVEAAELEAHLVRIGGSTASLDPDERAPPPGGLELRVAREAGFGQVYRLLRTTSRYHLRPFLYLPSAAAAPAAPTAPPPPVPPVPRP